MKKETRARLLQGLREKADTLRTRALGDAVRMLEDCVRTERTAAEAARVELVQVLADIAEIEREERE